MALVCRLHKLRLGKFSPFMPGLLELIPRQKRSKKPGSWIAPRESEQEPGARRDARGKRSLE